MKENFNNIGDSTSNNDISMLEEMPPFDEAAAEAAHAKAQKEIVEQFSKLQDAEPSPDSIDDDFLTPYIMDGARKGTATKEDKDTSFTMSITDEDGIVHDFNLKPSLPPTDLEDLDDSEYSEPSLPEDDPDDAVLPKPGENSDF